MEPTDDLIFSIGQRRLIAVWKKDANLCRHEQANLSRRSSVNVADPQGNSPAHQLKNGATLGIHHRSWS